MELAQVKGFKVKKAPATLGYLAIASGAFWKFNKQPGSLPSYFTLTLEPYQIPQEHFDFVREVQPSWNQLLIKLSCNIQMIERLHAGVTDPMISNMLKIAQKVAQKNNKVAVSELRCDYIFNEAKSVFQQTQFNAMSVGLWTASDASQRFHQALQPFREKPFNLYVEPAVPKVISAFKEVYDMYSKEYKVTGAGLLIVATGEDSDVIEQAEIEKQFLLNGIPVIKASFGALAGSKRLEYDESSDIIRVDGLEIAVVYYRQGYTPQHYSAEGSYLLREKLEVSRAVCVPNINIQLLNFKNVQTLLKTTNLISEVMEPKETEALLKVQTTIFTTEQITNQKEQLIKEYGKNLVVKSIHEGSEENYFYDKAIEMLRSKKPEEIMVMEYIASKNRRIQCIGQNNTILQYDAITEMGLYGVSIFKSPEDVRRSEYVGYLCRTFEDGKGEVEMNYGTKGIDALAFI